MTTRMPGIKPAIACCIALLLITARSATATTVIPKSVQDCIHDADAIFVGDVVKSAARWGTPTHEWIYTDITFHIDEVLQANAGVRTGKDVTLTYWGGSLDGRSMMASDMVHPKTGERWVLMLKPNLAVQTLTPVVGVQQGMLRVDHDKASGQDFVREAEGATLFTRADGAVVRGFERTANTNFRPDATLVQFESWLRANIAHIKSTATKQWPAPDAHDPRVMPTFSKRPAAAADTAGQRPQFTTPLAPATGHTTPAAPAKPIVQQVTPELTPGDGVSELLTGVPDSGGIRPMDWSSFGYANVPIVVNDFPASFAPWSPEDQYALSRWNYYSNIYRVYANPTGTFAGDDGVFDLDGWPDDATISAVYGQHWDTAGGELAVTFSYQNNSGLIVDADIAFNPAWAWTLDDNWVFSGSYAWPFRSTMQHEMGHMFGLKHDFNDLSIMNYMQHDYRALAVPYMDDAEAIRSIYPSQAQAVSDLGVYLWESVGYQTWGDPSNPSYVVAGDSFFINNYHMENVGNETIGNPTLEWYLTTSLNYSDPYYYLGTINYNTPLPRYTQYNDNSVGVWLGVPGGIPGGSYYINAYIRNDGGGFTFPFNNNEGWTHSQITVYPVVAGLSVSPDPIDGGASTTGTITLGSAAGSGGLWVYVSSSDASTPDPGWVNVPWGASSASFTVSTNNVTAPTQVTLTATSLEHSASTTLYLTVPTAVQAASAAGIIGTNVNLTGTLTRTTDNAGVSGETLYFYVDGSYVGAGGTDGNGDAILPYTLTDTLGTGQHTVEVDFYGDYYYYDPSYNTSTLTVSQAKTKLALSNATGNAGQAVTLQAVLTRTTDKAGVSGATVNFSVAGSGVGTGTTDSSGTATCSYTIPSGTAAGKQPMSAQFGGDGNYSSSSAKANLTVKVVPAATVVTVTNMTGTRGKKVSLQATLTTKAGAVISGASLQFALAGSALGSATTNASGQATLSYSIPKTSATGKQKITVKYVGATAYKASSGTGTLTVK